MRHVSAELADSLASGATTWCTCWRITRRDGHVFGFTDHDADLAFNSTKFEAAAGMTQSEAQAGVGLMVDNLEIQGAITSDRLAVRDLEAGLYDGARVEVWRVDWTRPDLQLLLYTGSLGEVKRSGAVFKAEIRGLADALQHASGRLYQHTCDAQLGDSRCRVDLAAPGRQFTATISARVSPNRIACGGGSIYAAGWFARGLLEVVSGAMNGARTEIKRHDVSGNSMELSLWQPLPAAVAIGDMVRLTVGCDKHIATCRDRFDNAPNFRGFPDMPGNTFVTGYSRPGEPLSSTGSQ